MASKHSSGARKRWKRAIDMGVEAVPGKITKDHFTLTYRLRGGGYEYDEETDFWYYIKNAEERLGKIKEYQAERAEARRIQGEEVRRKKDEARGRARRVVVIAA